MSQWLELIFFFRRINWFRRRLSVRHGCPQQWHVRKQRQLQLLRLVYYSTEHPVSGVKCLHPTNFWRTHRLWTVLSNWRFGSPRVSCDVLTDFFTWQRGDKIMWMESNQWQTFKWIESVNNLQTPYLPLRCPKECPLWRHVNVDGNSCLIALS